MFEHYLPNKNEHATVAPKSKFMELNKGLIYVSGSHGVRSGLRADDVVRGEERAGVHVSLHPCHPDHGCHDGFLLSP